MAYIKNLSFTKKEKTVESLFSEFILKKSIKKSFDKNFNENVKNIADGQGQVNCPLSKVISIKNKILTASLDIGGQYLPLSGIAEKIFGDSISITSSKFFLIEAKLFLSEHEAKREWDDPSKSDDKKSKGRCLLNDFLKKCEDVKFLRTETPILSLAKRCHFAIGFNSNKELSYSNYWDFADPNIDTGTNPLRNLFEDNKGLNHKYFMLYLEAILSFAIDGEASKFLDDIESIEKKYQDAIENHETTLKEIDDIEEEFIARIENLKNMAEISKTQIYLKTAPFTIVHISPSGEVQECTTTLKNGFNLLAKIEKSSKKLAAKKTEKNNGL